jgi:predicted Zn-dependent protease
LAERLDMPVGYFADDGDDGVDLRNRRLLEMILSEYRAKHYDLCLQYCDAIGDYDEIVSNIRESARLGHAMQMMNDGHLREAHKLFSSLAKDQPSERGIVNLCRLYRALLAGFLSDPETGREEPYLRSLRDVATEPNDLATMSVILTLLDKNDAATAKTVFALSIFSDKGIRSLIEGRMFLQENKHAEARKSFIEAMGHSLVPPLRAYALTLLEKCAAAEKDFENAYAYLERRRELVSELTKKN